MISILEYLFLIVLVAFPWAVGCMYIAYRLLPGFAQDSLWRKSMWDFITFRKDDK